MTKSNYGYICDKKLDGTCDATDLLCRHATIHLLVKSCECTMCGVVEASCIKATETQIAATRLLHGLDLRNDD